jgi:hypothetical protein
MSLSTHPRPLSYPGGTTAAVDPITAEIVRSALVAITDETR